MSSLPEMCDPYVFNSKEVGRQKALNIDQDLIFKSVFNSPFKTNGKTRTKAYRYYDCKAVSMRLNIQQQIPIEMVTDYRPEGGLLSNDSSAPAALERPVR